MKVRQRNTSFPRYFCVRATACKPVLTRACMNTRTHLFPGCLTWIYSFFNQFACLSEYMGPRNFLLSWQYNFENLSSVLLVQQKVVKILLFSSSMVSSISNSLRVDQSVRASWQTHKSSNIWHLSGCRQMSSLKLFSFNRTGLRRLSNDITFAKLSFRVVAATKPKYHAKMNVKKVNCVQQELKI